MASKSICISHDLYAITGQTAAEIVYSKTPPPAQKIPRRGWGSFYGSVFAYLSIQYT